MKLKRIRLDLAFLAIFILAAIFYFSKSFSENKTLKEIIRRLSADSRIAEVLVVSVGTDPQTKQNYTTIKFVEYNTDNQPLPPRYFTFFGNIIQFQSMVVRFDDFYVYRGHPLKGKSAYMFMKAFSLDPKNTQVFEINKVNEIPTGYEVKGENRNLQKKLWERFWRYALDPLEAKSVGVKNAQIEAPGTKFIPGMLYTIKIEHHAGMRIDVQPLPGILKGEKIDF